MNKGGPIVIVIKLYSVVFERLHTTKEGHTSDTIPKYSFLFLKKGLLPKKEPQPPYLLQLQKNLKKNTFHPKLPPNFPHLQLSPLLVLWNAMNEGWPSICQNIKTSISGPCLGSQLHLLVTSVESHGRVIMPGSPVSKVVSNGPIYKPNKGHHLRSLPPPGLPQRGNRFWSLVRLLP